MENEDMLDEFEEFITEKYGHMAEEMLCLADGFLEYIEEKGVKDLNKAKIRKFTMEYLGYSDLSTAEASMLFQTLIAFCDFAAGKGMDCGFFKEQLLKNKENLYDCWTEEPKIENSLPKIDPKEFIENFDAYYSMAKMMRGNKKVDILKTIDFLEKTQKLMQVTFEKSKEIRKNNPSLSEEEYLERLDEEIDAEHGKELFAETPNPDDLFETVFSLPKEQARKFLNLTFKLGEVSNFKFGTIERKEQIDMFLNELGSLIEGLKKTKEDNK